MADEADILGHDAPQRRVSAWIRPFAVVLVVCVGAGWFIATRDDRKPEPSPTASPPLETLDGEPGRGCGAANTAGLAWGAPAATVQPDGRLVVWRGRLCNSGKRAVTVESVRPLSPAERNLPAGQVQTLARDGAAIHEGTADVLPVRIPAGGGANVSTVSVVVGCEGSDVDSGLSASVRVGGSAQQVNMPVHRPGIVPVESWCNEHGPDGPTALPVLRDGAATVTSRGKNIDLRVPLFNPNGLPISLTGLHSPSPGVRVVPASAVTLPAGGRATASMRLAVESCAPVFVDAPWQLTFTGSIDGASARLAPVRLAAADWQAGVLRQICPATRPLATATSQPGLKVSGPFARGDQASYEVTQVVRNVSDRVLLLRARPRSAPGLDFVRVEVLPSAAAHQAIGETSGTPLRVWSMSPGASAFLTYTYRLGDDVDATCLAPPVDQWRAPVDATDSAGRPATVADEATVAPQVPQAWVGGWRVAATEACARPVRLGRIAPFFVVTGPAESAPDGTSRRYVLAVYGVPGKGAAVVTGARLVGAFAHLPVVTAPVLGTLPVGQRATLAVSIPIHCPPPGVPVTLAVSYQGETQPVLVELRATPTTTGQPC